MGESCKKNNENEVSKMEMLLSNYEKKTHELEEREMEVRYRLQMLENTMPTLMMWNMWRMMLSNNGGKCATNVESDNRYVKEGELVGKLKALEAKLSNEKALLEDSKRIEADLKEKIDQLEAVFNHAEEGVLEKGTTEEIQILEMLSNLARERLHKERRLKELQVREKMYHDSLQRADDFFTEFENEVVLQGQGSGQVLFHHHHHHQPTEHSIVKEYAHIGDSELPPLGIPSSFKEKLSSLEEEARIIQKHLEQKEKEKMSLVFEETHLKHLLGAHLELIEKMKGALTGLKSAVNKDSDIFVPLSNVQIKTHLVEKQRELEMALKELKGDLIRKGAEMMSPMQVNIDDKQQSFVVCDKRGERVPPQDDAPTNKRLEIGCLGDLHTRSAREMGAVIAEIDKQTKFKGWLKADNAQTNQVDAMKPLIK